MAGRFSDWPLHEVNGTYRTCCQSQQHRSSDDGLEAHGSPARSLYSTLAVSETTSAILIASETRRNTDVSLPGLFFAETERDEVVVYALRHQWRYA